MEVGAGRATRRDLCDSGRKRIWMWKDSNHSTREDHDSWVMGGVREDRDSWATRGICVCVFPVSLCVAGYNFIWLSVHRIKFVHN